MGRLLAPARPASTPGPALRRSHFPGPPLALRPRQPAPRSVLRAVPAAPGQRRPTAAVKRPLLDRGEDRSTLTKRERRPLDTEGSQDRASRAAPIAQHLRASWKAPSRASGRADRRLGCAADSGSTHGAWISWWSGSFSLQRCRVRRSCRQWPWVRRQASHSLFFAADQKGRMPGSVWRGVTGAAGCGYCAARC